MPSEGGVGVWEPTPIPSHLQHNIEETQQMVDAILGFLEEAHDQAEDADQAGGFLLWFECGLG